MSDDELIDDLSPVPAPHQSRIRSAPGSSAPGSSASASAQPIIPLNYSERIPDHRTGLPGLYLANTTQIYPEDRGTNYSVRLGNQIAALVADDLAASIRCRGS